MPPYCVCHGQCAHLTVLRGKGGLPRALLFPFHCWSIILPLYPRFTVGFCTQASLPGPPVSLLVLYEERPPRTTRKREMAHSSLPEREVGGGGEYPPPGIPSTLPRGYPHPVYTPPPASRSQCACRCEHFVDNRPGGDARNPCTSTVPAFSREEKGFFYLRINRPSQEKPPHCVQQTRYRESSRTRTSGI